MSQRNLRRHFSKYLVATALALGSAGSLGMALHAPPARAQITVFDPSNYSQNLLTAARTLQQINNQIQSLQNQATMLTNQAKNLSRIDFPGTPGADPDTTADRPADGPGARDRLSGR